MTEKYTIVFDSGQYGFDIENTPEEIEMLLSDSPVVVNHKENNQFNAVKVVGNISNAHHRSGTLYYGDVILYGNVKDFNITNSEVSVLSRSKDNKAILKSIITYVEIEE